MTGFGYWNGLDALLEFKPAPENSGITFVRPDLPDCPRLTAHVSHRIDIPRRTVLDNGQLRVEMIEHLMAALAGLQIDNCEVWIDRDEVPGLDGSARAFVETLHEAGIETQKAPRERLLVTRHMRVEDGPDCWIEARPALHQFKLDYHLDFPTCPAIGRQTISLELNSQTFCQELATARTFILDHEAEQLRQRGLCERVSYQDVLVFSDQGVIDNQLRFDDECVRHKALDFVGDFALAPFDIVGHFTSCRSSHKLNAQMVKRLLQEGQFVGLARDVA